jgi:hypothetical protein
MSKFTSHDYTTQTGKTLSVVTLPDILKAAGLPVEGATCFRGGSGTKLAGQFVVNWLAPKAAGTAKDEKASKGAASKGTAMAPEAKAILEKARPLTTAKRMVFFAAMLEGEEADSPMLAWVESAKVALAAEAALVGLTDKMMKAEAALAKPDGAAARLGKKLAKAG